MLPCLPTPRRHNRRAFTLLEILVVFTIIAILVSVVLLVGHKVAQGSKARATQNVIQSLDQALDAYIQAKGGNATRFPDRYTDDSNVDAKQRNEFPLADARIGGASGTIIPAGEFAVEVLKREPSSAAIIQKIPSEFTEQAFAGSSSPVVAIPMIGGYTPKQTTSSGTTDVIFTRVKDAWGRPIHFVHPAYHGIYGTGSSPARDVTVRQNNILTTLSLTRDWTVNTAGGDPVFSGTGDGGFCKGGRPYFYSAGPDGNPATVEDNVYTSKPEFDAAVKAAGQ